MSQDQQILINLSGRGDKDIFTIADAVTLSADSSGEDRPSDGVSEWRSFIVEKAIQYVSDEVRDNGSDNSALLERISSITT